ncbi:hypothetical protein QA612_01690 [Evansella sp. AB-P1]|uniref:hypothetical protein n=1 Tax=Evansella sp. AB-P1 TaxID=3037653 RepID=UPI00241DBC0C|nr:hypothetical protein [Evansella sp. AB-P1]MDG5786185.1 hypothetical protein [Evansella sp. AB-P1]
MKSHILKRCTSVIKINGIWKWKALIIITFIILIAACSTSEEGEKLPKEMPEDFDFVLKYGYEARNIINTYENTYTKNMIMDEDITIGMSLSNEEREWIYEKMVNADILNSAENASEIQCADPHEKNELTLTLDGEAYEREWITSYCQSRPDNKLKKLTEAIHREMIMMKEEYKELPEPTGAYE